MAPGLFRPFDLRVVFEERPYKLCEEITFNVELKPRRDVKLREGRIDLVCEENYVESTVEMMDNLTGGSHGTNMGSSAVPLKKVPRRITKKHRNRFVHSSIVFLGDTQCKAGQASEHHATLAIRPEAPSHYGDGNVTWSLEIVVDIVGYRDITQKKSITITI